MTGNDSVKFEILGYFVVFIKAENILLDSVDLKCSVDKDTHLC